MREGLQTAFGEFGEVADVRLPFDRDNQCLKGFGYIVFAEANGAPVRRRPPRAACERIRDERRPPEPVPAARLRRLAHRPGC